MTQQYQNRLQRITMLVVLLALVAVIAGNVFAGSRYIGTADINKCKNGGSAKIIETAVTEMEDVPWRPLLSMIWQ